MAPFLQSISRRLRRVLRPAVLRLLSWTERGAMESVPSSRPVSLAHREVGVPTGVVAFVAWAILFTVLFLELGPGWRAALALFLFTGMLLGLFIFYVRHDFPEMFEDEEAVALLGLLAVSGVWIIEIWRECGRMYPGLSPFGVPLAAASLLTALLLRPRLAIILTVVLGALFGLIHRFSLEGALVMCIGGLTGVARCLSVRTRRDISRAGLWVALAQALTVVIIALLERWPRDYVVFTLAWTFAGGVLSALIALAVLSPLESFFSRLTNIRLLELADVNHPLLKRMSVEAPGTYHHSLIMASLAQAAAEAVGANGLLCRVGAYFHDIGKMTKPEYFVENQGALGNPHDPLPPNMSRLVIQSHVKEGVALAREHGLDPAITDFITMHHGTSRIEYFYRRALEQSENLESVGEDEYRYPGPRPRSRETAILMLADSVEASARTIEEPTHQRLQDHVRGIINAKLADGQFDEVPLTMADIHKIADSFVNTLVGVYHTRIRYPDRPEGMEPEPRLLPGDKP